LLAYVWAWAWCIPVILTGKDYQESPVLFVTVFMAIFGPGLGGILMTYREGNREARREFWRRLVDLRRIRSWWIPLMLLLWPGLHLSANLVSMAVGAPVPPSELAGQMAGQPVMILAVPLLYFLQAILEDIGWRGYMLERVLRSSSPSKTSLIVGLSHSFWHLPFFFVVGTNQMKMGLGLDFWLFVLQATAFSFYATWCYLDNGHSTLSAILLHTIANLCNDLFVLFGGPLKFRLMTLFMLLGAAAINLLWQARKEAIQDVH
jgi:membrane protease YdiL (CAAX protease family)